MRNSSPDSIVYGPRDLYCSRRSEGNVRYPQCIAICNVPCNMLGPSPASRPVHQPVPHLRQYWRVRSPARAPPPCPSYSIPAHTVTYSFLANARAASATPSRPTLMRTSRPPPSPRSKPCSSHPLPSPSPLVCYCSPRQPDARDSCATVHTPWPGWGWTSFPSSSTTLKISALLHRLASPLSGCLERAIQQ
jgi:hypothetical protein